MLARKLTDRTLLALKPAADGSRYELRDSEVPGLRVIVSGEGRVTFALLARFPGSAHPSRRPIGVYGKSNAGTSLEEARDTARTWRNQIRKGIDPRAEAERARRAELRRQADTVDAAIEDYIRRVLIGADPARPRQRRGPHVARELRREFALRAGWQGRPISEIDSSDVKAVIAEAIDRGAPHQARNLLGSIKTFFNWAVDGEEYGLTASPCDRIKANRLIGEKKPRQRVLDDAEIAAFWAACDGMGYPFGPALQLMLLTGARESEIGRASWGELDAGGELLTVPAHRFKSGTVHLVPLSPAARRIVDGLPRFSGGDFIFSTSNGVRPSSGYSKAKVILDRLMAEGLGRPAAPFRIHDLRRTVRTRLASLRVPDAVAEMAIGHGKRGLQRTYDIHHYLPEIREALDAWAERLAAIVAPAAAPPGTARRGRGTI